MSIDWVVIDKVVEWVRSRLYELCLPTERTFVLFKYTIDDPVRTFLKPKTKKHGLDLVADSNKDPSADDIKDLLA